MSGAVCVKSDTLHCPCAVITGEAWYDQNGDGIAQQTENGINGMQILLVDAMSGKIVSSTETTTRPRTASDDGYYEFPCVLPGMYYVQFDSLHRYTTSSPYQGGDPATDSDITGTYGLYTTYKITVQNGDTVRYIDGGYKDTSLVSSGHLTIAGHITAGPNKAMLSSKVLLSTSTNPFYRSAWSHYSGNYAFADLIPGQDYSISAEYDEDHLKGVSTLDVLLIQKHILGIKALDSPYKLIAADVTNSQSITAADLTEIRRLILGVTDKFPKNKSWRFIPKNYSFKNPSAPFPFQESILHSKMTDNKMSSDFYAVKIGDVNGNALELDKNLSRSSANLKLTLEKSNYLNNQDIIIPVSLSENFPVAGLQLALKLDENLEFVALEKGGLNVGKENYNFHRGLLLISFNEASVFTSLQKDLFTLRLRAKVDLNTDGKIVLSNVLDAEVYSTDDKAIPMELNISIGNSKSAQKIYKFYPARPNPFKQETYIEFELSDTESLIFTIFNPDGKLVWRKESTFPGGHNQLNLSKQELGKPGLYYLHIHSNGFYKTQRILLIE
ncbi:MAG: T9SS type A sorting domain-containing protein [Saprospiraceae bacterium]|nr:T9SS type A sorting domain-containing protein [Candidatus Vicinibacter affinis]